MVTGDEDEIRDLLTHWAAAVQAEDIDGILADHSPEIVMFDVPPPFRLDGIDAYRQSWLQMFGWFEGTGTFEITDLSVEVSNDLALCVGALRCHGSKTLDEPDLAIRMTVGLRKVDGRWIVVHEHHSQPAG